MLEMGLMLPSIGVWAPKHLILLLLLLGGGVFFTLVYDEFGLISHRVGVVRDFYSHPLRGVDLEIEGMLYNFEVKSNLKIIIIRIAL
jgi:hypothetical protein